MWNKNERDGNVVELTGKAKQAVGHATRNPDMVDAGVAEETAGQVQAAVGTATRKVGEAVERVGKTIMK
jgi:uncharacterized protein YjbJ (UPF0337 family)